jgi:hypothetical protein
MLKRALLLVTMLVGFTVLSSAQEEELNGAMILTGDSAVLDEDAGTLVITGYSPVTALRIISDGEPINSFYSTLEMANGWKQDAELITTGTLQLEATLETGELEVFIIPVELATPVLDDMSGTLTFNVTLAGEIEGLIDPKSELPAEITNFVLFIDYDAAFAERLGAGISTWFDTARPTTSRPCNPRTAC